MSARKENEDGWTNVRPLCDDTNLRRARPISAKTIEWVFRHSISNSYEMILARGGPKYPASAGVPSRRANTDLDIQILINLDSPAENEDPLCKIGKLPHVANAIKETSFFWRLDSLHLLSASLPGRHHLAGQPHYGTVTVAVGTGRQREENYWLVGGMECGGGCASSAMRRCGGFGGRLQRELCSKLFPSPDAFG